VVFGVAFVAAAGGEWLGPRSRLVALAAQTLAALLVTRFGVGGFQSALLAVIAGQAPLFMPARAALAWILVQTTAAAALHLARWTLHESLLDAGAFLGFQLFALGAAYLAQREATARAELARLHAELLATQELVADGTRAAERLRIARELHDSLGHHLTALSLQLELARNVAVGPATEPVAHAHALTKQLLAELRDVVGSMRNDQPLDLAHALRTLVAGVPRPRIHLTLPGELRVDAALAHTLFRCVQEAVTNAIRHAGAGNLWIDVAAKDDEVTVRVRDDGRGTAKLEEGNGLRGLKERVEGVGGRFAIATKAGRGFELEALVPLRGGGA
jgi:signal transduction histidine kinase